MDGRVLNCVCEGYDADNVNVSNNMHHELANLDFVADADNLAIGNYHG